MIKLEALVALCFQLLDLEQEKQKEAKELLEKQQHNLLKNAELKQEIAILRNENRNLQYVLFCICCHFCGCRGYVALNRM